jgi:hypothetical protein
MILLYITAYIKINALPSRYSYTLQPTLRSTKQEFPMKFTTLLSPAKTQPCMFLLFNQGITHDNMNNVLLSHEGKLVSVPVMSCHEGM